MISFEDFCIVSWNIRGVMHEDGKLYVKDLLQHKKLDICIIIEPRCKFARVRHYWNSLSFSPTYLEEAVGFRGGIWVLKNDRTTVSMRLLHQHNQAITFELWRDNYSWACTAIYASPFLPIVRFCGVIFLK